MSVKQPSAVPLSLRCAGYADSREEALAILRAAMPGWLRAGLAAYTRLDGLPHETRDPVDYTEHLCAIHPVGDPEYCADVLRRSIDDTGIKHLRFFVEGSGDPDLIVANIARLGREVLPRLRYPE